MVCCENPAGTDVHHFSARGVLEGGGYALVMDGEWVYGILTKTVKLFAS